MPFLLICTVNLDIVFVHTASISYSLKLVKWDLKIKRNRDFIQIQVVTKDITKLGSTCVALFRSAWRLSRFHVKRRSPTSIHGYQQTHFAVCMKKLSHFSHEEVIAYVDPGGGGWGAGVGRVGGDGSTINMERNDSPAFHYPRELSTADHRSLGVGGGGWDLCSPTISVQNTGLQLVLNNMIKTCNICWNLCSLTDKIFISGTYGILHKFTSSLIIWGIHRYAPPHQRNNSKKYEQSAVCVFIMFMNLGIMIMAFTDQWQKAL